VERLLERLVHDILDLRPARMRRRADRGAKLLDEDPVGLVLATPMTVCLVVMGRHIPRLSFLSVVLSDEKAFTPAEDCYYRLLTPGVHDEIEFVDAYLKANSLTALYDAVVY
jgi:hypothetical protein